MFILQQFDERCPYYLLKISKTELDEFISHKKQEKNKIKC